MIGENGFKNVYALFSVAVGEATHPWLVNITKAATSVTVCLLVCLPACLFILTYLDKRFTKLIKTPHYSAYFRIFHRLE